MKTGKITRLIGDRGFGFITPDTGTGRDIFFHSNEINVSYDDLVCGQSVAYEVENREKGDVAVRVTTIGSVPHLEATQDLVSEQPESLRVALKECNQELLAYVTRHPEFLYELHPGAFEALIAEIYRAEGFETERISNWNEADGGVDLIAIRHVSPGVDFRVAVQCKRWSQRRRLSAEPLRSLAGVLDQFQAHVGVVATTGLFSRNAEDERNRYLWRISLRDYNNILATLKRLRLFQ